MTAIDLSPQLDAIRRNHREYWHSREALAELIALWGGAECNEHGVLANRETTRIDLDGWAAEVHIARAPNGWHAVSTSYWYSTGGGGSSPSVWSRTAYTTHDEALAAGIADLIHQFEGVRDWQSTVPQLQSQMAERMIDRLASLRAGARQLSLF